MLEDEVELPVRSDLSSLTSVRKSVSTSASASPSPFAAEQGGEAGACEWAKVFKFAGQGPSGFEKVAKLGITSTPGEAITEGGAASRREKWGEREFWPQLLTVKDIAIAAFKKAASKDRRQKVYSALSCVRLYMRPACDVETPSASPRPLAAEQY